jgi:hypothetical protein
MPATSGSTCCAIRRAALGSVTPLGANVVRCARGEMPLLDLAHDAADDAGVRFAPKATLLLRRSEMTRWAAVVWASSQEGG